VTRQKVGWQRQAARDLAEGRFDAAVAAFDRNGAVTWTTDQEASRTTLVERCVNRHRGGTPARIRLTY
jgi:hypothetical protein